MKIRNHIIDAPDRESLNKLVEEYRFIGRETVYDMNTMTVTVLAVASDVKKKQKSNS